VIRRPLVRSGILKGIIGLPANLFYGTCIPACILVLDKENAAARTGVSMIDASKGFIKDGNKRGTMLVLNDLIDAYYGRVLRRLARIGQRCSATALLAVVGCGSSDITCPLLPDRTGLTVQLASAPIGAFTVEVIVSASPPVPTYVYVCDGGVSCRGVSAVYFPGLVPASASIRVTTTVGTRITNNARVTYTDSYPNGRRCEPRSTTGTVVVPLPL